MDDSDRTYTIGELAKAAGTTPRTVRFYQAEGLMPPAGTRGRYSVYGREHLDRLRLIQQLKRAYLPLSAIRAQLGRLTAEQIQLLVEHDVHVLPEDAADAARYVADLLETRRKVAGESQGERKALWVGPARTGENPAPAADPHSDASRWERYVVADGVELHVRENTINDAAVGSALESLKQLLGAQPEADRHATDPPQQ